jgi:toxin ParE1/3/4
LKVVWTQPALDDVDLIATYLHRENPAAAFRILEPIAARARDLAGWPEQGRAGRVPQTRELVVDRTPYLIAYRVLGDRIEILAVLHGARRWPQIFRA